MSKRHILLKIVLPILILVAGAGTMLLLVKSRPAPEKKIQPERGALVELLTVAPTARRVEIWSTGTVRPRQEVAIIPQVSGRVKKVADGFVSGGFLAKGELLFAIEPVDYQLAVERARAGLAQAENELATVESKAAIARNEWQRFKGDAATKPNPLVLYEPQLKNARANLAAAKAALRQAEIDLNRTELTAPFNCRVLAEDVEYGQYVKAGNQAATVIGTDAAEIVVSLTLDDLQWLTVPRRPGAGNGSAALVRLTVDGRPFTWQGRIVRRLGEVEPKGRMAQVVVRVDDPYGQPMELSMGLLVEVLLQGKALEQVVALPRKALRDEDSVWVMDDDQRLRIRQVHILRLNRNEVLIDKGLVAGDRVVLTNIAGAADGMKLRAAAGGTS